MRLLRFARNDNVVIMVRYFKPETLSEVLSLLADKDTRFPLLAGGTDLIVQWRMGGRWPSGIVDIGALEEIRLIIQRDNVIEIGAAVTHSMLIESHIVRRYCPVLVDACKTVGAVQIQNRGTIGGNIVNASPAGDTPPVLLAFDALVELASLSGRRHIPLREFYLSYRKTALKPDEILTRIIIPKHIPEEKAGFYKIGTRKAQAISKVALCARAKITGGVIDDIAIALGSVAPTVVRAPKTETFLKGKKLDSSIIDEAKTKLSAEVVPIDDIRSTADYRRFVAGGLLGRFLSDIS